MTSPPLPLHFRVFFRLLTPRFLPLVHNHNAHKRPPLLSVAPHNLSCSSVVGVMAQGRGSAVAMGLALLCLLVHSEVARAATFVVGDSGGWTFSTAGWPSGKRFRAGDVLEFRYNPWAHNVVAVSAAGYRSCSASPAARVFTSGNDRVTLARGTNHFICSLAGHCESGMKIAVTAV
ncbi:chemocyanin-like [Musa acuminata AAA Group]|uniref:chemocyanin-like n=1 Tax=Musa acuminata AAA Group TaxID=214697 RepID=UPI0031D4099D